jgi:hypothetical protein
MSDDEDIPTELLNSDDLGDVGETEFHALAAKGPMIVNKAVRDRAGWDFVVQAAADNATTASLDERQIHWTSYVQVKAAWDDRKPGVRLSLVAAEKLAKHRAATFIAVLLFDRLSRACKAIYIVELAGDRLSLILKTLREHQRQGARAINDSTLSLPLNAEERLKELSGPAIRERLAQAHRQAGPDGYETFKTRELKTLGWTDYSLRGEITLDGIDTAGLADVLLGRCDWQASLSGFVETRFGVDLPARNLPDGPGRIRFSPSPQAQCELTVSWPAAGGRLVFSGDHHTVVLPGTKSLERHSRFRFPAFVVDHNGRTASLKTTNSEIPGPCLTLSQWRRFWRMMVACGSHPVTFVVRSPLIPEPVKWTYPAVPEEIGSDVRQTLMAVQAVSDLDEQLDLGLGAIRMRDIAPLAQGIVMARHFGMPGKPHFIFTIKSRFANDPNHDRSPQDGVFIDFVDLGDARIAFAARLRLTCETQNGVDLWSSEKARRVSLRSIGRSDAAFVTFVEEAKRLAAQDNVFLGDIDDDFLQRTLGDRADF